MCGKGQKTIMEILTKEYITNLKRQNNGELADLAKQYYTNSSYLTYILESLGHLPSSFDYSWILPLLNHPNENVRFWAVKSIGKTSSEANLDLLFKTAWNDESTTVKREAVSSIGRMRCRTAIPFLIKILQAEDPKIICQAIRGLLVFKAVPEVEAALRELINHENETIRTVIYKEFFSDSRSSKSKIPHTETYPFLKNVIVNGDVREVMKYVPDDSIHLTFTSPHTTMPVTTPSTRAMRHI